MLFVSFSGNVVGVKPYETGPPKCQNFGMYESAKYPGLCKPFGAEPSPYEYALNSINPQPQPAPYYTYKTYNSQYDSQKKVGSSSSTSNNVQSPFTKPNYATNPNNEVHSYIGRQETQPANQQQYSNQQGYQPNSQVQKQSNPKHYPASPFQQAFTALKQQQQQKRPIDPANPFHTYQWNLLFKPYL